MRVQLGQPYPLGATWDGLGVNFALFSEHATRVDPQAALAHIFRVRRYVRTERDFDYFV